MTYEFFRFNKSSLSLHVFNNNISVAMVSVAFIPSINLSSFLSQFPESQLDLITSHLKQDRVRVYFVPLGAAVTEV